MARGSCWITTPLAMELASGWIETVTEKLLDQQIIEISRHQTAGRGGWRG